MIFSVVVGMHRILNFLALTDMVIRVSHFTSAVGTALFVGETLSVLESFIAGDAWVLLSSINPRSLVVELSLIGLAFASIEWFVTFEHRLMFLHQAMVELSKRVAMVIGRIAASLTIKGLLKVPMQLSERAVVVEDWLLVLAFESLRRDCNQQYNSKLFHFYTK